MRKIGLALSLICAGLFLAPIGAHAQATRTWVSGVGDDANPCSRTAPCKTFAGSIVKTDTSGEINCLDPGGFGAVTITKSFAIICDYTEGGITSPTTTAVTVNAAGASVYLSGLDLEGIGSGVYGVNFLNGASLTLHNCTIRGYVAAGTGYGVRFVPSSNAALNVLDSTLEDNGIGGTGGAIFVQPSGTAVVTVAISNTHAVNNGFGFRTDSSLMTGGSISTSIMDSEASVNANAGIAAISTPASGVANTITIARTTVAHNNVGLNANGSVAGIHIGSSMLFDNATGVKSNNSGTVDSFGGNQFYNNPTGPGPTLTIIGPF